jgi:hypothetical protein
MSLFPLGWPSNQPPPRPTNPHPYRTPLPSNACPCITNWRPSLSRPTVAGHWGSRSSARCATGPPPLLPNHAPEPVPFYLPHFPLCFSARSHRVCPLRFPLFDKLFLQLEHTITFPIAPHCRLYIPPSDFATPIAGFHHTATTDTLLR